MNDSLLFLWLACKKKVSDLFPLGLRLSSQKWMFLRLKRRWLQYVENEKVGA